MSKQAIELCNMHFKDYGRGPNGAMVFLMDKVPDDSSKRNEWISKFRDQHPDDDIDYVNVSGDIIGIKVVMSEKCVEKMRMICIADGGKSGIFSRLADAEDNIKKTKIDVLKKLLEKFIEDDVGKQIF